MTPSLTVGDFSKASHLSVKTLRHYHDVGVLEPVEVNPDNGYRYYSPEQIPTAQVIRRLRDLEMPIPEVKAVLAAPDAQVRNDLIAAHLDRLESELVRTRESVEGLRNLLQQPTEATPIEHRTVAAAPAMAIRGTIEREDVLAWWQGALGELHAGLRAQHLVPDGPSGGLYAGELIQDGRGEAVVFIPTAGSVRSIGRIEPFVVPAGELAVATHVGALTDIDLTYGVLGGHVTNHAIGVDGPLREYYLRGADDTENEAQWMTEICWPIFRADRQT